VLSADWWVYSFSGLSRADAGGDASTAATLPVPGGRDEPATAEAEAGAAADAIDTRAYDPRFAGTRFGVALHAALEHADFAAWRQWLPGDAAPADEARTIARALRAEGFPADVLDDGVALVTRLVGNTLRVVLPEGVQLC